MKKLKKIDKVLIVIFGLLISLWAISYIFDNTSKKNFEKKESDQKLTQKKPPEEILNNFFDESTKNGKDSESKLANLQKEGSERTKKILNNAPEGNQKLFIASSQIYGPYLLNVNTRYEFCKKYGVDIGDFIKSFKEKNIRIYTLAKKIQIDTYRDYGKVFNEDEFSNKIGVISMKTIDLEMNNLSKSWQVDLKQVCENLNLGADKLTKNLIIEKNLPEASKIILDNASKAK